MLALLLTLATAWASPTLDTDAQARVDAGEVVLLPPSPTATARAVVRIEASPERIWTLVSDPEHLKASAGAVKALDLYKDEVRSDGKREQRLAYTIKVAFSEVRYNVVRTYDMTDNVMIWTLDTERENDLATTDGSFSLFPQDDGSTLFAYEVRVDTGRKLPKWIQDELTESSLKRFLRYLQETAPV